MTEEELFAENPYIREYKKAFDAIPEDLDAITQPMAADLNLQRSEMMINTTIVSSKDFNIMTALLRSTLERFDRFRENPLREEGTVDSRGAVYRNARSNLIDLKKRQENKDRGPGQGGFGVG